MLRSSDLLKEGTRHLQGVEEAVIRNIEAVKELTKIIRTSMGPQGMNKMVINHLEKLFVTNDAATIISELDVFHPAAKLACMSAKRQEEEIGDATNLVLVLCGEFLTHAESLLRMGLHTNDIVVGFEKAGKKALQLISGMSAWQIDDLTNEKEVAKALRTAVASKQYGYEDLLSNVIAQACIGVYNQQNNSFNVDNVRVAKLVGGGITDIKTIRGIVVQRDTEGTIKHAQKVKVAVFSAGIDFAKTETKEQFLVTNAGQLENYATGQEDAMEKIVKEIVDSGAKVIVSGGKVAEMAMHFFERYKLMVVKTQSRFELQRICRAVGATAIIRMGAPTAEELGYCDSVSVEELGSTKVTIFQQTETRSKVSTIICRAATPNILDDLERAIDDGVNTFKQLTSDNRFLAGAGASEIELAKQLKTYGESTPGQDQYAIKKFAESLEVVPRTLAENSGHDATNVISKLYAAHSGEKASPNVGIDVETGEVKDAVQMGVLDLLMGKKQAIRLATDAAISVLRVDQIIMAKPAVGPKPPAQGGGMDTADDI